MSGRERRQRGSSLAGTATREELAAAGLAPGGQPVAGWRWRPGARQVQRRVPLFVRAAAVRSRPCCLAELARRGQGSYPVADSRRCAGWPTRGTRGDSEVA